MLSALFGATAVRRREAWADSDRGIWPLRMIWLNLPIANDGGPSLQPTVSRNYTFVTLISPQTRAMRKMSYLVLAPLALLAMGALTIGCQSCYRATDPVKDLRKSTEVPAVIAHGRLLSYSHTLRGTMRWPLRSENVEICKDDSSRCIIRLSDYTRVDPENFDSNGDPLPDSMIVGSEVLDSVKRMIVDAKAWRFKDDYSPRSQSMDGDSWSYSALFSVTDSMLAAAAEDYRRRLASQGGLRLSSGGSNGRPDTRLFEQIRLYLQGIFEAGKKSEYPD